MAITVVDGVNTILRLLGEAPVASVATPSGPLTASAVGALESFTEELCARPWFFNTHERNYSPGVGGQIVLGSSVLDVMHVNACDEHRYTIRAENLYDVIEDTDIFTNDVTIKVVVKLPFESLTRMAQAFVVAQAAVELAGGLADTSVTQAVAIKYRKAEADFMRHVRQPGRYSFFDPATRYRFRRL